MLQRNGNFKSTNPNGNLDATFSDGRVYIGAVNEMGVYDFKTREKLTTIQVNGFAPRARVFSKKFLMIIADTFVYLYNNEDFLNPTLIQKLDIQGPVIDFILLCNDNIAYVLCQNGLKTIEIIKKRNVSISLISSIDFDASLDANLTTNMNETALYIAAVTHGNLLVFNINDSKRPKLARTLVNRFLPVIISIANDNPNVMVVGGIFGLSFYDIHKPLKPVEINSQESPYLNLIRILPGTNGLVANVIFGPKNQLVIGKLQGYKSGKKIKYKPLLKKEIQFGRLPWDILVVPLNCSFNIIIPNSTEPFVNSLTFSFKRK